MPIKWFGRDARWMLFEADKGAGDGSQPTDGEEGSETQPSETQPSGENDEAPDVEQLQSDLKKAQDALKKANAESAERRKKLQEFEAAEQKRKEAEMSEAERAQQEAERAKNLESELRKTRADVEIAKAASKLGVDAELASRLVDVEFDDDGKPQNVEAALTETLNKHPYLRPAANSNPANPGRKAKLTVEDVKKMSPDQINARWDEVQETMKASGQ